MATSGLVISSFSQEAPVQKSTVDRMLRVLRAAGMAPMGVPGRGKTEGHFAPLDYACLILGFGGSQPSDAAEAAAALSNLEWHSSMPQSECPRVSGTFSKVLESFITDHWKAKQNAEHPTVHLPDLLLLPIFKSAQLHWPKVHGGFELIETYGPAIGIPYILDPWSVVRQTIVKRNMLTLARSLWRDTPKPTFDSVVGDIRASSGSPDRPAPGTRSISKKATMPHESNPQPHTRKGKSRDV